MVCTIARFFFFCTQPIQPPVQPRTLSQFLGSTVPRYKKLISWADAKEKKTRASTVPWTHCFPSYATMDKAWSTLSKRQVLKTTIKDGRVGVRWDVDDWIQYIGDQRDVLEEMHFPRFRDDHPYVLIVRGDGFPCGARSWCQIACGFANHMQKARTLLYNWTLDLALVSEHETDHGVGDHPMLVHTHPKDDSPLTGEIALGDFVGGELFTSALLCSNGPSRPAWIRWGRDLLWGHIVDPRYGVMFNALRPHVPLPWSGQRIVLVPYTGIAWGRLPVAMQNELVTFGFPR